MSKRITVVGGGAAGMMAAITAAEEGAQVTLLEPNERLGKKLNITGKPLQCDQQRGIGNTAGQRTRQRKIPVQRLFPL